MIDLDVNDVLAGSALASFRPYMHIARLEHLDLTRVVVWAPGVGRRDRTSDCGIVLQAASTLTITNRTVPKAGPPPNLL